MKMVFYFCFLILSIHVGAQQLQINSVKAEFEGSENYLSEEEFLNLIEIQPGSTLNHSEIDHKIRKLSHGLIEYIELDVSTSGNEKYNLLFKVFLKKRLRKVEVISFDERAHRALRDYFTSELSYYVEDSMIDHVVEVARDRLIDSGYRDLGMDYQLVRAPDGLYDLTINVNLGSLYELDELIFLGNQAYDRASLVKISGLKEDNGYLINPVASSSIPEVAILIQDQYRADGFLDAVVVGESRLNTNGRSIVVEFQIQEGVRYRVRKLTLPDSISAESIDLPIGEGDFFEGEKLAILQELLRTHLQSKGYVDAVVSALRSYDLETSPGWIDVQFRANKGKISYIDEIQITGNQAVPSISIFEYLTFKSGDVLNMSKLDYELAELVASTPLIKSVDLKLENSEHPEFKNIVINVNEALVGNFHFGFFSSAQLESVGAEVSVTNQNFGLSPKWGFKGNLTKFESRLILLQSSYFSAFKFQWDRYQLINKLILPVETVSTEK